MSEFVDAGGGSPNHRDSCFEELRDQVQELDSANEIYQQQHSQKQQQQQQQQQLISIRQAFPDRSNAISASSKSSSFLTIPKEDTSQILITEQYAENVIRGEEQCIHVKEPLLRVIPKKSCFDWLKKLKKRAAMAFKRNDSANYLRRVYLHGTTESERQRQEQATEKKQDSDDAQDLQNGSNLNYKYMNGAKAAQVSDCLYSWYSLVPVGLFNHLKQFNNFFLVLIAMSQILTDLKVGQLYTYLAPLVGVLVYLIAKEGYDDFKRHIEGSQSASSSSITILTADQLVEINQKDLEVGQIILLSQGQAAPADILLLFIQSDVQPDQPQIAYARTDQLDGKTTLSPRYPVEYFCKQSRARQSNSSQSSQEDMSWLLAMDGYFEIPPPTDDIHSFKASYKIIKGYHTFSQEVSISNTLFAGCSLLSCDYAVGIVIYNGKETKRGQLRHNRIFKINKLDLEVSFIMKILFGLLLLYAVLIVVLKGNILSSYSIAVDFLRYFILLSSIIPASLKINLEILKMYNCWDIKKSSRRRKLTQQQQGIIEIRNQNIAEDLGRIQIMMTDKTGTLTTHSMSLSRITLEQVSYTQYDMMEMESMIINQCMRHSDPFQQTQQHLDSGAGGIPRNKEEAFRELITVMALCNNVQPSSFSEAGYIGISPDEIALVRFAKQLGISLSHRSATTIQILSCNDNNKTESFEILEEFPFSSETRRMGMIIKHAATGKLMLLAKGAADEMKNIIVDDSRQFIEEEAMNLANEGLRALVFASKQLSQEQYNDWKELQQRQQQPIQIVNCNNNSMVRQTNNGNTYKQQQQYQPNPKNPTTNTSRSNSDNNLSPQYLQLMSHMTLLGLTGSGDLVSAEVQQTVETLQLAGIQLWVISGDGVEQTKTAAINSGIKTAEQHFHSVLSVSDDIDIKAKLEYIDNDKKNAKKQILVIDGQSLNIAITFAQKQLVQVCTAAAAVLFCKCSSTQKRSIVELVKKHTELRVCAIGNGSNDVSMIQSAHLGIGLLSESSKDAYLSSDIGIEQFSQLSYLIAVHGRLGYKRGAQACSFVLQRGLLIAFIEFIFISVFYTISLQIFNAQLLLCYASIFTFLPTLTLALTQHTQVKISVTATNERRLIVLLLPYLKIRLICAWSTRSSIDLR